MFEKTKALIKKYIENEDQKEFANNVGYLLCEESLLKKMVTLFYINRNLRSNGRKDLLIAWFEEIKLQNENEGVRND